MSDGAYSMLLLAGLLSGSAAAFLVRSALLPVFAVFPLSALLAGDPKALLRTAGIALLPGCTLVWALWSDHGMLAADSARWLAAVGAGSILASALGSSRAAALLHEASLRTRSGGLLESLSMVLALAGPFSQGVRRSFRRNLREGLGVGPSVAAALDGLGDLATPGTPVLAGRRHVAHLAAALAAWLLFTLAVAGLV